MRLLLKHDIQAVIVPISSFILLLVCLTLRDEVCAWIWIRDMRQHAKSNIDYAKTLHRFWYHFCFGFAFIMPGCFPITLLSFFFSSTHCIFQTKIQSSVFNWVQRLYDKKWCRNMPEDRISTSLVLASFQTNLWCGYSLCATCRLHSK